MEKPKPESEQAWLFCDSDFTELKQSWSPRRDTRKRPVKNSDGSNQTLLQWLSKYFQTPFDANAYWYYMEEPYSTYFAVDGRNNYHDPRKGQQVLPYRPDSAGRSHFCTPGDVNARMFKSKLNTDDPQYLPGPVLVICMGHFLNRGLLDEIPATAQTEGTLLANLDTKSHTLLHELIHLVEDGWSTRTNSPDAAVWRSVCARDANGKCVTEPPKG